MVLSVAVYLLMGYFYEKNQQTGLDQVGGKAYHLLKMQYWSAGS